MMLKADRITSIVLAGIIFFSGVGLAQNLSIAKLSKVKAVNLVSHPVGEELSEDGFEFLQKMALAADSLKSYSFQSAMTVFKGNKTIQERSNFYFKKPRLMRAEEVGSYKRGATVVLGSGGVVRGHFGGVLSKLVVTISPRSSWLLSANDYPFVDSDFYGMSQVMLNFVREGKKCLVTHAPVSVEGQTKPVYIVELYTDTSKRELMKRAYTDSESLLPVEWFDYKDKKLFAHTVWKNLRVNIELSDTLFQL